VSPWRGAGGTTRDKTVELVCRIKHEIGIEAMAHLTCVGADREEIHAVLKRLHAGGIENVLALRGDPPRDQKEFVRTANGFAVGDGHVHSDPAVQDARDAAALYDVLEGEVIPLYYSRGTDNVPHGWVARIKHSIASLAPHFNADRMLRDYVRQCYLPAAGARTSSTPCL